MIPGNLIVFIVLVVLKLPFTFINFTTYFIFILLFYTTTRTLSDSDDKAANNSLYFSNRNSFNSFVLPKFCSTMFPSHRSTHQFYVNALGQVILSVLVLYTARFQLPTAPQRPTCRSTPLSTSSGALVDAFLNSQVQYSASQLRPISIKNFYTLYIKWVECRVVQCINAVKKYLGG